MSRPTGPIVVVAGARPNFMKVAPLLRALAGAYPAVETRLVHTGQHYDPGMSDVFFEELGIPAPSVHLNVGSGTHGAQTARVLAAFEEYLLNLPQPARGVIVVGDVNSTMACTIAAVKLGVRVAHVEAGLRSFDRTMPEEINRVLTDAVADLLLTSEREAGDNLAREGVAADRIHFIGNVMIDTLVAELPRARERNLRSSLGLERGRYALVTLHRPANVDGLERLSELASFLERTAARIPVVFPVHPRTRGSLGQFGLERRLEACRDLRLLAPLGYRDNLSLMADAMLVLTDSGGIQEETTYLGVQCLTLRENTERPATITHGTNTLVGHDLRLAERLIEQILAGKVKPGSAVEGWDGKAAQRAADIIINRWG
ncbi:MAG: UDP-N-acetylglucosamine 2-epimerase (non-hydrolyzing) [Polyangiaceae bacterium]